MFGRAKNKGFTLIELVVTMAVMAIVFSMAIPSFNGTILNNKSTALGGELNTALNFARAEAIKRSARISICPSSDGVSCLTSSDWAKGWLVFVDTATSDSSSSVTIGTVLRFWGDMDKRSVVTVKKGSSAVSFVRYTSSGVLARLNATDTDARVAETYLTGCKGKAKSTLRVGITGMTTASKTDCP